jgi:hypothetical protein
MTDAPDITDSLLTFATVAIVSLGASYLAAKWVDMVKEKDEEREMER